MLNAEMEDEIVCVFMCVFEGVVVADKIHINSSHVQAPASPGNPDPLLASMLPSLRPEDAALRALSYPPPSHIDSPLLCFKLLILDGFRTAPSHPSFSTFSPIVAIVARPGDADEGGVSYARAGAVANADPLRCLCYSIAAHLSAARKQTKEEDSAKEEASN